MLLKNAYMYILGTVDITVEGFFIEKFINICNSENIILWSSVIEKGTILRAKINKADFKKIRHIAKKTNCRVVLNRKNGLPFVIKKYRKRKIFAISFLVIAIFCFSITRFVWNIEVTGNEKMSKEEIISELGNYGIAVGKLKSNFNIEEIKNEMRLNHGNISWIGIDIKGTNVIVKVVEAIEEPEIIDENTPCNIVAEKSGTISKMIIRNGTARKNVGDEVSEGDLLVEGVMEGKYTGQREVHSDADIYILKKYEKEKKEPFVQQIKEKTGNEENYVEIYINNFKIFFNKGVPKFKKCDTIRAYKKVKLFSNYYIPMEIVKVTNFEIEETQKNYTELELTEKITKELEEELNQNLNISDFSNIRQEVTTEADESGLTVKVVYLLEEKIGTKDLGKE